MPKKKSKAPEDILSYNLIIRVNEATFKRLDKLREDSHQLSIAEVCRKILTGKQLKLLHKDISMDAPMEEMALIRKELKAIGININQLTRGFNQDKSGKFQAFYLSEALAQYQMVGDKVDRLLVIIAQLAEKWLQRS